MLPSGNRVEASSAWPAAAVVGAGDAAGKPLVKLRAMIFVTGGTRGGGSAFIRREECSRTFVDTSESIFFSISSRDDVARFYLFFPGLG